MARWSSGLRLRPLTPATWVRIPYGSPKKTARKRCRIYMDLTLKALKIESVPITMRVHPFPSRTRKLSSLLPTILGWKRPGKIGRRRHKYRLFTGRLQHSSIAQSVEHAAVNRRVVGSSPTGGAKKSRKTLVFLLFFYFTY